MTFKICSTVPILWLITNYLIASVQSVPLIVWTSEDMPHCTPEIDLYPEQSVSTIFSEDYMSCLNANPPQNILVFLVEGLSIEDMTLYGNQKGSFENIQYYVKANGYSIPSIEPANMLEDIKMTLLSKFQTTSFLVHEFEVPVGKSAFDELDQQIIEEVQKVDGSYLAILSSNGLGAVLKQHEYNTGRHLLQAPPGNTGPYCLIGDCVQICFSDLQFNSVALNPGSSFTNQSCTSGSTSNTVTFTSGASTTVKLTFTKKLWGMSGLEWWDLSQIFVNSNGTIAYFQNKSPYPEITAPLEWSIGCASPSVFQNKTNSLSFKDLQVQAFTTKMTTFQDRLDCSGWFTGPIWAGLLISLLLITMLSYAYSMISSITTMDKFDNPKGKTISVPQES